MGGKLFVVGIGPGDPEHLTPAARAAIESAGIIVGDQACLDLIPELLAGKELLASGMRQEVERCRQALERAAGGAAVALVSGGDAGIYGVAGLVLKLANERVGAIHELPLRDLDIEIVPAVSTLQAAARLGASESQLLQWDRGLPVPSPQLPAPKKSKALFIGGTGSGVGKSVLTAGLCRLLRRKGVKVLPFKAQTMALNAAVTPQGGEIGWAQALQAAACAVPAHTDMNPVLLKPNSNTGSQVIVQGRPVGNMNVTEYHAFKTEAFVKIEESFLRLAGQANVVVIEGAGSIAEINLRDHDIANLKIAAMAGAPVLLVADIDRGGVFASIIGTVELLTPEERAMLAGVIINRFRGDLSLLAPGIAVVEARTGVPILGVVPWIDLKLPEEDSLGVVRKGQGRSGAPLRIGVVRLPCLSNYTDFDPLEQEVDVDLCYVTAPEEIADLDLLILPGTKSTLPDLLYLRTSGLARAIHDFHMQGGQIAGICGGYQLLGKRIDDPDRIESDLFEAEGLGLLDVETILTGDKQAHLVNGKILEGAAALGLAAVEAVAGYEIHMGLTSRGALARPLFAVARHGGFGETIEDGAVSGDGRTWGTYLHGLFDDAALRHALLDSLRRRRGLAPATRPVDAGLDGELDRLAEHLAVHLDLERIWSLLDLPTEPAG